MQRFRDFQGKFGVNKWKKNGQEPMNLDKIYNPFRETYPMQIRNWVLGKGANRKESPCVPDMMKLFECLQKNEYHQTNCDQQLAVFQSCYNGYLQSKSLKKTTKDATEPVPGSRKLSTEQLNTLLKRYPHKLRKNT